MGGYVRMLDIFATGSLDAVPLDEAAWWIIVREHEMCACLDESRERALGTILVGTAHY
jgi:hypothetical protein